MLGVRYLHGQDFVEGFVLNGPGDDRAPVSPGFKPGGRGGAEGCHHLSEGFSFGFYGGLYPVSEVA